MSTPINGYVTLTDMLAFLPNSGNASTTQLEQSIEAASRAIEMSSGRIFIPTIRTNYYDVPRGYYPRELCLGDDLLEVITLTNGDGSALATTEWDMWPYNWYPKATIIIKRTSAYHFVPVTATGDKERVIPLLAVWGYHNQYSVAWITGSTLNGGINDSVTSVVVASSTSFVAGQIIRVDNELMRVTVVTAISNTLTVDRGWNGSTAAAHLTTVAAKIWRTQGDIIRATMIQTGRYYARANAIFGTVGGGEMGAQPIAIPQLDPDVAQIIDPYIYRL